jgi:hypothetical protein
MQDIEMFHGRDFTTVFQQRPFKLLFHDTVKLRIRLEDRDISVPISILLLGVVQLLSRKEFSRDMCLRLLGKEWGYQFVARMLLECDDVCLKPNAKGLILSRIRLKTSPPAPVKPPPNGNHAANPKAQCSV